MAKRRMFSLDIVDTDIFLDMPPTTQNLYFHLGMRADDDGFVAAPKKIAKLCNSTPDDIKILVAKGYIIPFDDGVVLVTDWMINNQIRKDRYTETRFKEHLNSIESENGRYKKSLSTKWQPNGNQMATDGQPSIGKDSIDKVSTDKVNVSTNSHRSLKEGHPFERLSDHEYLRSIGAAAISEENGKLHPTAAGMLMFGDEYNIVRHFPEYFLDYREELDPTTRWSDRLQSSSGEWSGNVCDFYFRVYNKIIKDVKVPFKMSGGERIDDTPVHKALREALANCLINADYHGLRGVVIRKEPDKLILANPGYIRTGKKQMRLGGESDPRNKALMKMFNLINIGERAGSGVPNIFNVWADEGWEEPVIEERFDPDRTVLTLSFKKSGDKKAAIKSGDKKAAIKSDEKKVTKKTQMQYDKILEFMEEGKEYGIWDFCELLGLKESRTKDVLKGLADYIEIIGSNKDRRYRKK